MLTFHASSIGILVATSAYMNSSSNVFALSLVGLLTLLAGCATTASDGADPADEASQGVTKGGETFDAVLARDGITDRNIETFLATGTPGAVLADRRAWDATAKTFMDQSASVLDPDEHIGFAKFRLRDAGIVGSSTTLPVFPTFSCTTLRYENAAGTPVEGGIYSRPIDGATFDGLSSIADPEARALVRQTEKKITRAVFSTKKNMVLYIGETGTSWALYGIDLHAACAPARPR